MSEISKLEIYHTKRRKRQENLNHPRAHYLHRKREKERSRRKKRNRENNRKKNRKGQDMKSKKEDNALSAIDLGVKIREIIGKGAEVRRERAIENMISMINIIDIT